MLCCLKFNQPGNLHDRRVVQAVLESRAGIARRDEHLLHPRALRELPCKRVLAAAGSDYQQFHFLFLELLTNRIQCLKWRMPVNTIATPRSSAVAMTSGSRTLPPSRRERDRHPAP